MQNSDPAAELALDEFPPQLVNGIHHQDTICRTNGTQAVSDKAVEPQKPSLG